MKHKEQEKHSKRSNKEKYCSVNTGILASAKKLSASGIEAEVARPPPISAEDIEENMTGPLGMGSMPDRSSSDAAAGATSLAEALNAEEDLSEDGDAPYIAAIAKDMERQVWATKPSSSRSFAGGHQHTP